MAVDHALWISSSARGVAHDGRAVFTHFGPLKQLIWSRGDQVFVSQGGKIRIGRGRLVSHHHKLPDAGDLAADAGQYRNKREVDENHAILGMVDEIGRASCRERVE